MRFRVSNRVYVSEKACAWRGLRLTEPAKRALQPHDFWRVAVGNLLSLNVNGAVHKFSLREWRNWQTRKT